MRRNGLPLSYPYGPATDVYAFGLILWELVTNEPLFDGIRGKDEITEFVCGGGRPAIVTGWPQRLVELLQTCWHADAQRRPSFTTMQSQFGNLLIDYLCPDALGRRIARALWLEDEMLRVPYADFEATLEEACGIDFNTGSQCYRRCLQVMLCDPFEHRVTFERFCNMIQWFGTMNPILDFLGRIVALFECPWFFGFIRGTDAKNLLVEQQRRCPETGFYLFRFSETLPGSYTIYSVSRDGKTSHRRVSHQYNGRYAVTIDGVTGEEFDDLLTLHDRCCEVDECICELQPLPGAPYQPFFDAPCPPEPTPGDDDEREVVVVPHHPTSRTGSVTVDVPHAQQRLQSAHGTAAAAATIRTRSVAATNTAAALVENRSSSSSAERRDHYQQQQSIGGGARSTPRAAAGATMTAARTSVVSPAENVRGHIQPAVVVAAAPLRGGSGTRPSGATPVVAAGRAATNPNATPQRASTLTTRPASFASML